MIKLYLLQDFEKIEINPKFGWYAMAFDENNLTDRYLIFLSAFTDPAGIVLPIYNCCTVFKKGVFLDTRGQKYVLSFEYLFPTNYKGELRLCN